MASVDVVKDEYNSEIHYCNSSKQTNLVIWREWEKLGCLTLTVITWNYCGPACKSYSLQFVWVTNHLIPLL